MNYSVSPFLLNSKDSHYHNCLYHPTYNSKYVSTVSQYKTFFYFTWLIEITQSTSGYKSTLHPTCMAYICINSLWHSMLFGRRNTYILVIFSKNMIKRYQKDNNTMIKLKSNFSELRKIGSWKWWKFSICAYIIVVLIIISFNFVDKS